MEDNKEEIQADKPATNDFLVVGIGASAEGLEALQQFFEHVPADSYMAYVVILHLSPDFESQLATILGRVTSMPVMQVTEKVRIEPNHVYVVSPNHHLMMIDGEIAVSPNLNLKDRRAPVDIFFRTLADNYQSRSVGVILSGTGANGSMGIKRIKECGGTAFVQNPREAKFNEMPRNAIATDLIDGILPVTEIPAKILQYKESLSIVQIAMESNERPDDQEQALKEIFTLMRKRTGHDFSNYKRPTLLRRIERRINVHNLSSLAAYASYLNQHHDETSALLKDLLISVTNFFRDNKAFEIIEMDLLPRILLTKKGGDTIRIWVIGCATGEEAYSIAMLCAERTINQTDAPKVQIFATDIDEAAITAAREGLYTLNDAADVSQERLNLFFTKEGDRYRIRREIRERILFANHNVLKDPPFSHIDMVSCRNMMIYLNSSAQERVLETVHFALEPGGYLFLGMSESVDNTSDLYVIVNREHHIYQSRAITPRSFPMPQALPKLNQITRTEPDMYQEGETRTLLRLNYAGLHQRLLEQYAPPSIVVNEEYDIIHLTDQAGKYLQITGGEISKNLLHLIRTELRLELRTAFYQAVQQRTNVEVRDLKVRIDNTLETINIHVRPVLHEEDTARGFMLVLFEQSTGVQEAEQIMYTSDDPLAYHLEEELVRMKARLRSTIEQHELQSEELKASNEELQTMNEELRSTAEELETSKEELQSMNEELTTVNQELKVKVEEITISNNNFQNLINSTDIATIFLDRSLRINMFTPAAKEIFNVIPSDYGRLITDITNNLDYTGLLLDAETVLEKLTAIEGEVRAKNGKIYLMRTLPYRTDEDRINGVVITFINITERKKVEEIVRENEERLRKAISIETVGVIFFDLEGNIIDGNAAIQRMSGYSNEDFINGKVRWDEVTPPEFMEVTRISQQELLTKGQNTPYEKQYIRPDGTRWWGRFAGKRLNENMCVEFVIDITESKRAEEALRTSESRFRTLTDAIPHIIWTNDANGKANYFNLRWYEYSGLNYEQSEGLGWQVIVHPDDAPTSIERWQKAFATGKEFNTEYRLRRADGIYRWHLGRNMPLRDEAGNILGWFGSATDVEDLTKAQTSLRESEERTHAIVNQTSVGILNADTDGNIVFMNEKGRSMFGFKIATGVQSTLWELTPNEDIEEHKRLFTRLITEGLSYQFEKKLKRQNGTQFWASVSMAPIKNTDGKTQSAVSVIVDVTGRKQAEEALRETIERFQYAVQATKDVIWEIDFNKDHVWWSSMMHTLFGYTQREVQHSIAWYQSLIHPDDRERVVKSFTTAVKEKETLWADEFRYRKSKGEYLYVICRSFIIRDEEGKAMLMIGAMQDITERRLAEEAVRKSEERLRVTMESATDYVIITTDINGNIENWNSGAERIFGYHAAEVRGKYGDFFYTPEDRAAGVPKQEMKTAWEKGRAADERWHLRKDGTRVFMSGVLAPIRDKGLKGYVKVARDMTAQKETENALLATQNSLNTALEAAKMGIWDLDLATNTVRRSFRHDQLLGYPTYQEDWSFDKAVQYMVAEDKAKFVAARERMFETGIFDVEARIQHTDENVCWVQIYGRLFRNENNEPTHAAGVIFDITDRKTVEQRKEEFIGIASHELKTPVTSIKAYTEILHDQFVEIGDMNSASFLQKLNGQVDRLTGLIRDLLDATRISEGRLTIKASKFDLNRLLRDTTDELQRTTSKHTIELTLQELPLVAGDKERLQQVFVNLLSNAIKYSPEANKVLVKSFQEDGNINITIQDFGVGISKETQHKLFERFFRSSDPHLSTFPGLGLGLYISKEIVKQHKGNILVQSERNKGSLFTVVLPVEQ